jgi:hypothetical protein
MNLNLEPDIVDHRVAIAPAVDAGHRAVQQVEHAVELNAERIGDAGAAAPRIEHRRIDAPRCVLGCCVPPVGGVEEIGGRIAALIDVCVEASVVVVHNQVMPRSIHLTQLIRFSRIG